MLAADFGTTKTYFSKCPGDDPSPVSIDFGDGRDGIPSAILYREGKEPLVGQTALDTYGEASPEERRTLRLRTNFKADLVRSEAARAAAADFLAAVLAGARKQHLDLEPDRRQVLFGVPSEADDSFRSALRETARRGGFGSRISWTSRRGPCSTTSGRGTFPPSRPWRASSWRTSGAAPATSPSWKEGNRSTPGGT